MTTELDDMLLPLGAASADASPDALRQVLYRLEHDPLIYDQLKTEQLLTVPLRGGARHRRARRRWRCGSCATVINAGDLYVERKGEGRHCLACGVRHYGKE